MKGWVNLPLRSRLYAITLLTVLSAMVGLAVIVDIATRQAIFRSIDGELFRRSQDFARVAARGPGGRPGEFPPRMGSENPNARPGEGGNPFIGRPQEPGFDPNRREDSSSGNRPNPGSRQDGFQRRGGGPGGGGPGGGMGMFFRGPNAIYAPRFLPVDDGDFNFPPEFRHDPYDAEALKRSFPNRAVYSDKTIENEPVRVLSFPVERDQKRIGTVQAVYPLSDFLGSMNRLRMVLLTVILPLAIGLSLLGARFIVGLIERPLRLLKTESEEIQGDRLDRRLPVVGNDEFAQLSATVNQMLDRIQVTVDQEREAKRTLEASLERQKRFTADASHELKTPIAVIKAHAGLLKTEKDLTDDAQESIESIDEASDRMTRLVKNLLLLARLDAQKTSASALSVVNLSAILEKAVDSARTSTSNPGASIETHFAPDAVVVGSQDDLLRLFQNLIENALKYGTSAESSIVRVRAELAESGAVVTVQDHGPGIPAEHIPHLFERFYRVDKSRSTETGGTGLGLSICHEIVRSHGGELTVESELGKGTSFVVRLPLANTRSSGADN